MNPGHYNDVIMGAISSQNTSLTIVYSTVDSDVDQVKYQSSASLAFVRGIHRGPGNSPHKWPVTRTMFHLMTSSWICITHAHRDAVMMSIILAIDLIARPGGKSGVCTSLVTSLLYSVACCGGSCYNAHGCISLNVIFLKMSVQIGIKNIFLFLAYACECIMISLTRVQRGYDIIFW